MNKADLSEGAIIFFIAVSLAFLTNFFRSDSLSFLSSPKLTSVSFLPKK